MAKVLTVLDQLIAFTEQDSNGDDDSKNEPKFRSPDFLLQHIQKSMDFFNTKRCIDKSGGFYHFYGDSGTVYDTKTRVLVTEARFIFTYAVAYEYLGNPQYLDAVRHGVNFLRGPLRNTSNGAYHWVLVDGKPTDSKIYTYAMAFVLLAYSKAFAVGIKECKAFIAETFDLMEEHLFESKHGLYAEEADSNWKCSDYRSESGNLHTTEALIAAFEATKEDRYLERAMLIASNITNRQAGLCQGLVWEHYNEDWTIDMSFNNDSEALTIFRPWGFQPGHQVEWARLLIVLSEHQREYKKKEVMWLIPKAKYLFDIAVKQSWDPVHGGLAYSFDPDGSVCDWDKIFWVQVESIGTAAMLAVVTGEEKYLKVYDRIWKYSWMHMVDHKHGSWYRRCNRTFDKHFLEKTKLSKCVDPDYHILGGLDGALRMMKVPKKGLQEQ